MSKMKWNSPPEMQIDTNKTYTVSVDTNKGLIELELYPQHAPKTVNNFVFLAKEGFYDGVSFHRVIPDFVIQGGDPTGSGSGGPGYQFEDEVKGNPLRHERGVISMANAGPNTNGGFGYRSGDCRVPGHLNGKHTVFGKVVTGLDVVDEIRAGDTMQRVTILEE